MGDVPIVRVGPLHRSVAEKAQAAATRYRFFHWQLEFPEVFFAPRPGTTQDIQLTPDGGFDAVIGNPPYDELSEWALGSPVAAEKFLRAQRVYAPALGGRLNWFQFFAVRAMTVARRAGRHSFIVPMSLMADQFSLPLREMILDSHAIESLEALPQKDDPSRRVFKEAKLPTCVYVLKVGAGPAEARIRTHPANLIEEESPAYTARPEELALVSPTNRGLPLVSEEGWATILLLVGSDHLGKLAEYGATPSSGEIVFNAAFRKYLSSDSSFQLVLRGGHVQRYEIVDEPKQGEPVYIDVERYLGDAGPGSKAHDHKKPRVVYQEAAAIDNWRRVIAAYLDAGNICGHKICYFKDYRCHPMALLAIFNSRLIDWVVTGLSTNNSLPAYLVGSLPFPKLSDGGQLDLPHSATLYLPNQTETLVEVRRYIQARHELPRSLEALLASMAQRMIALHEDQDAEQRRFLDWLESKLRPGANAGGTLRSLRGGSMLREYAGDYQRNLAPLTTNAFESIVRENEAQFAGATEGRLLEELRTEFEGSKVALRPIISQLEALDDAIDRLVFAVYAPGKDEGDMRSLAS